MIDTEYLRVTRAPAGSRPSSFGEGRVCSFIGCDTVLSKYNKGPGCYIHQPRKKFRVRGVLPSEQMEKENQSAVCMHCLAGNRGGSPFVMDGVMHISGENGKATVCEE